MTKATYEEEKSFAYSDFDIDDHILLSHVAQVFQDIAGDHSQALGCGYEKMKAQDIIWVLARNRIDVLENPKVNRLLTVETSIKKPLSLIYERELIIKDKESGKTLITGISNWVLASLSTRRLIRPKTPVYPLDLEDVESLYKEHLKTLPTLKTDPALLPFKERVHFVDLDHNRHMNNCRYCDVLTNALSPKNDERISSLEIDYEKECVEGEELSVHLLKENETSGYAFSYNENNVLVFKAHYTLSRDDVA